MKHQCFESILFHTLISRCPWGLHIFMCSSWSLLIEIVAASGDIAFLLLKMKPHLWNFSSLNFISYGFFVIMTSSLWLPKATASTLRKKKVGFRVYCYACWLPWEPKGQSAFLENVLFPFCCALVEEVGLSLSFYLSDLLVHYVCARHCAKYK